MRAFEQALKIAWKLDQNFTKPILSDSDFWMASGQKEPELQMFHKR